MIRILIADDSPIIRDGLSSLLEVQPNLKVVDTARDGLESVEKAGKLLPDIVIMDAQMPRMDGVEATRLIKQAFPTVGVLFFSVFLDCMEDSMAVGSDGCLVKDCEPEELFSEIRRIAAKMQAASELSEVAG